MKFIIAKYIQIFIFTVVSKNFLFKKELLICLLLFLNEQTLKLKLFKTNSYRNIIFK